MLPARFGSAPRWVRRPPLPRALSGPPGDASALLPGAPEGDVAADGRHTQFAAALADAGIEVAAIHAAVEGERILRVERPADAAHGNIGVEGPGELDRDVAA